MADLFPSAEEPSNFFNYDTSLNERYGVAKVDTFSEAASNLGGIAVGSVVDFGASVWNSLPLTEEVATEDLLSRISDNALNVYQENPDLIHALSFAGGVLAPGLGSMKIMNGIRNGSKAVGWFSTASKEAKMADIARMTEQGQQATKEYKTAMRSLYAQKWGNELIDSAAAEVAILGTMNAHPFLEDYWDNPAQNILLFIGGGTLIGGTIGHIRLRSEVKAATGAIESKVLGKLSDAIAPIREDMPSAVALQTYEANIGSLRNIIKEESAAGKTETTSMLAQYAEQRLLAQQGAQRKAFEDLLSGDLSSLDEEAKTALFDKMKSNPAFFGVHEVAPVSAKDVLGNDVSRVGTKASNALTAEPTLVKTLTKKDGTAVEKEVASVYSPVHNAFLPAKDLPNFATAADLGKDLTSLEKSLPFNYGKLPNLDADLEIISKSTAQAQGDIVAATARFDKMTDTQLAQLVVADNDVAAMQALYVRMSRDQEAMRKVKVQVADSSGKADAMLERPIASAGLAPDGRPLTYKQEVAKIATPTGFSKFTVFENARASSSLSPEARALVSGWVGGDGVAAMRKAASDFFGKGFGRVAPENWSTETRAFAELYESPKSEALRAAMKKLADEDGTVLLYRGWKVSPKAIRGHHLLESYALEPSKAAQFSKNGGTTALYRVHVDDIVAGINDVGGGKSHAEIIVTAGARPIEATLDTVGRAQFLNKKLPSTNPSKAKHQQLFGADLRDKLIDLKQRQADAMLAAGTPLQTVSLKLDIPMDTLKILATGTESLDDLVHVHGMPFIGINNKAAAEDILKGKNKAVLVKGNKAKNPYAEAKAGIDRQLMDTLNKTYTETLLRGSESSVATEIADTIFVEHSKSLDILRSQIGEVTQAQAGTAFFNSFDFWSRNMKDAGPIISYMGKRIENIRNNMIKRVVTPITDAMSKVGADPFSTTEFNTFVQLNHSLSKHRIYRDGQIWQQVARDVDGKAVMVEEAATFNGQVFKVTSPAVDELIQAIQTNGRELYKLANANRRVIGAPDLSDIGLWIPAYNPVGKHIAYVYDSSTGVTRTLYSNSDEGLASEVHAYKQHLEQTGNTSVRIYTKAQQREWSVLNNRTDQIFMQRASLDALKGGSGSAAIVPASREVFGDIAAGYEHYITAEIRKMADMSMSDITGTLRQMSEGNNIRYAGQPLTEGQKAVKKPSDPAMIAHNVLLGSPNLKEYPGWQKLNQTVETSMSFALNAVGDLWHATAGPMLRPTRGVVSSAWNRVRTAAGKEAKMPDLSKMDYEEFAKGLEERGILNPYQAFQDAAAAKFGIAKLSDHKDTSKRIVYAGNSLTATMLLRVGELAQPLVNIMSLPILTTLAKGQAAKEFMGIKQAGKQPNIMQIMHEGWRASNSPRYRHMDTLWAERGYYKPLVSEANEVLEQVYRFDSGAIATLEKALDSKMVEWMSWTADKSEALVRRKTMFTGYMLAKRMYPGIDDTGATIFARNFMDQAVGNFTATQRPVFFQGTAGAALGLFQTYMLTMGQNLYRNIELKNYKALGTATLMQAGLFGAKSLPGFEPVSQLIGEHFSDDHYDLTTGTYRALPDGVADAVLYGLPSNLGPAVYTRGAISPRLPNVFAGVENIASVNMMMQVGKSLTHVASALGQDNPDWGKAMLEAISLQSVSRPLARGAEILTGNSLTGKGNTVQTPEEVWTGVGIGSRLLSMRPFDEAKLREIDAANNFYSGVDAENRSAVVKKLKTAIRSETLSDERISKFALEYFDKGGTPRGWRSAYNEAIGRTSDSSQHYLLDNLRPDSPLNHMIDSM